MESNLEYIKRTTPSGWLNIRFYTYVIITTGVLLLVFLSAILFVLHSRNSDISQNINLYRTRDTTDTDGQISPVIPLNSEINFRNDSVHPCDDFFQFACENWQRKNPRPVNADFWNVNTRHWDKRDEIIIGLLEVPIDDADIPAFKYAQNVYEMCMAEKKHVALEAADLVSRPENYTEPENRKADYLESIKCLGNVEKIFKLAVEQKYLKVVYNDAVKRDQMLAKTKMIAQSVKTSMKKLLEHSISQKSFEGAYNSSEDEIDKITFCLGFPDWIFNDSRVQQEYAWVTTKEVSQFTFSQLRSSKREFDKSLDKSNGNMFQECRWDYFQYGATFHLPTLHLYISMLNLQLYFDLGDDMATLYGSIGYVIGHELIHGLYKHGWQTWKNGSMTKTENCLKTQYNRYSVNDWNGHEVSVNGSKTLEENFADNGGLDAAYKAYKDSSENFDMGESLRGTVDTDSYSWDQLFFLGFARRYCEIHNWNSLMITINQDPHSPAEFRVLGTLQNSEDFAKVWNCPVGSKMNPTKDTHEKCSVFPK